MDIALENRHPENRHILLGGMSSGMPVSSSPRGLDLEQMASELETQEERTAQAPFSEAQRDVGVEPWARESCGLPPDWDGKRGWVPRAGGRMLPPLEDRLGVQVTSVSWRPRNLEVERMVGGMRDTAHAQGPEDTGDCSGPTLRFGSEHHEQETAGAGATTPKEHPPHPPPSSPLPMQPASLSAAPLIPSFNGLDPRTLAASAWSRADSSVWAAPNLAGMLNASASLPSLTGPSPAGGSQKPLETSKRGSPTVELPVPDDLAARASGAWHASLGHNGLPPGTLGLVTSAALANVPRFTPVDGDKSKADLGLSPGRREWTLTHRPEPVRVQDIKAGNEPNWLSLDLSGRQETPGSARSPWRDSSAEGSLTTASQPPPPSPSRLLQSLEKAATASVNGNHHAAGSRQTAQLVEEQSAWYEQFKANIPNIAAAAQTVPVSTWAHVVGSGVKPPSPVLPSPVKPVEESVFIAGKEGAGKERQAPERQDAPRGQRQGGRRREADLLSRMEDNEAGGWDQGATTPPLSQTAGLFFGGGYNAAVEAARSKALKEIKAINLPPLLATTGNQHRPRTPPVVTHASLPATPPASFPTTPTPAIPSRALAAFLTAGLPPQSLSMDPLKPLDLPNTAQASHDVSAAEAARLYSGIRASPPASVSLRGWGARSGTSSVASLDMNSPVGGQRSCKRPLEGSDSGEEARRPLEGGNKKQKGKTGRAQEPSTKLTLELGGGGKGSWGEEPEVPRNQATPKGQSAAQMLSPGLGPSGLSGGAAASAAVSPSYAAYLESMKAGIALSISGGPARTATPTASTSGSGAASSVVQNRAPGVPKLWRSSSDETWTSEHARGHAEEGGRGEDKKGFPWMAGPRGPTLPGESRPWDQQSTRAGGPRSEGNANEGVDAEPTAGFRLGLQNRHERRLGSPPPVANGQQLPGQSPGRSVARLLGGYTAKLPGWPDKPMPADEYLKALQSSEFRLEVEAPREQAPRDGNPR